MWGQPRFDLAVDEAELVMRELRACREAFPSHYIKVAAYDPSFARQTTALSFIVNRPPEEPGFRLERTEAHDRVVRYGLHLYATDRPAGRRYANGSPNGASG